MSWNDIADAKPAFAQPVTFARRLKGSAPAWSRSLNNIKACGSGTIIPAADAGIR
jgi:hypothetical protein